MRKLYEKCKELFLNKQFLIFLIIGVVNTLNGIWLQIVISMLMPVNIAVIVAYIPNLAIAYLLNARFTFATRKYSLGGLMKFYVSYLPNFVIQYAMFVIVFNLMQLPKIYAIIAASVIAVPVTFVILKLFTFNSETNGENAVGFFTEKRRNVIAVCIIIAALLMCVVRCFYGFGWTDEAYYAAVTESIVDGERMFVDIWSVQQLSNLITVPIVWFYKALFGTTGLILFLRLAYTLSIGAVAIYMYNILKREYGTISACICSVLLLLFAPCSIATFSYNTMLLMFTALSFCFLLDGLKQEKGSIRNLLLFLCGISYALAVQSHPLFALSLIIPIAYMLIGIKCKAARLHCKDWLFAFCGVLTVCIVVGLFIQVSVSWPAVFDNIKYSLNDENHGVTNVASYLKFLTSIFDVTGKAAAVSIAIFTVAAIVFGIICRRKPEADNATRKLIVPVMLIASAILCMLLIGMRTLLGSRAMTCYAAWIALFGVAVFALAGFKTDKLIVLYMAGLIGYVAVDMGTNNKGTFSVYPMILSSIAVILYVQKHFFNNGIMKGKLKYAGMVCTGCVVAAIVFCVGYGRITYVYRDAYTPNMTYMKEGPAAGILTDELKAQNNEKLCETIKNNVNGDTIMFMPRMPIGYLISEGRVGSQTVWGYDFDSERQIQYYNVHPEKIPDCIFNVSPGYGYDIQEPRKEGEFWNYVSENYIATEFDCGTCYYRKP